MHKPLLFFISEIYNILIYYSANNIYYV